MIDKIAEEIEKPENKDKALTLHITRNALNLLTDSAKEGAIKFDKKGNPVSLTHKKRTITIDLYPSNLTRWRISAE
jgi:hypothetical protein